MENESYHILIKWCLNQSLYHAISLLINLKTEFFSVTSQTIYDWWHNLGEQWIVCVLGDYAKNFLNDEKLLITLPADYLLEFQANAIRVSILKSLYIAIENITELGLKCDYVSPLSYIKLA